jgi:hypothetical protein
MLIALVALLLLLSALAAPRLSLALWADEIVTVQQIGAPPYGTISLSESLARVSENVWHPPGYHVLLYFWGYLVGWTPFALRALSLFAGLLAVAVMAYLGRRYGSRRIGMCAALTLGASAFYVNYLYDMRPYSLVVLATLCMIAAYARAAARPNPAHLVVLALCVAATIYAHYFAALGIAALGVVHLVWGARRPSFWQINAAFIAGGLLFVPWAGVFIAGLGLSATNVRAVFNFTPPQMLIQLLSMVSSGAAALVIVLAAVGGRSLRSSAFGRAARFAWAWLIACLALIVIASRFFPSLFAVRYLIFVFPALAILSAYGIERLARLGVPATWIAAVWIGACLWSYNDAEAQDAILWRHFRPPFDDLRAGVDGLTLPDDALLYALPTHAPNELTTGYLFDHYLHGLPLMRAALLQDLEATTDAQYAADARAGIADARRVWLTYPAAERNWRVGAIIEARLAESGYYACGVAADTPIYAGLWARADLPPRDPHVFRLPDGGAITVDVLQTPLMRDPNRLFVALAWTANGEIAPESYSFALHGFDAAGALAFQLDRGLGAAGCYAGDLALDHLPNGGYDLRLGVYNWGTGERLFADSDEWRSIATFIR